MKINKNIFKNLNKKKKKQKKKEKKGKKGIIWDLWRSSSGSLSTDSFSNRYALIDFF